MRTLRILIAEDDPMLLEMFCLVLRRLCPDMQVSEAANGQFAYAHYQQYGADLIIANDDMPGICGRTLLRMLRDNHVTTPVILLSGYEDGRMFVQKYGHSMFLAKPVLITDLLLTVEQLLAN